MYDMGLAHIGILAIRITGRREGLSARPCCRQGCEEAEQEPQTADG